MVRGASRAAAQRALERRFLRDRVLPKLGRSVAATALLFAFAQAGKASTITVTTNVPAIDDSD